MINFGSLNATYEHVLGGPDDVLLGLLLEAEEDGRPAALLTLQPVCKSVRAEDKETVKQNFEPQFFLLKRLYLSPT